MKQLMREAAVAFLAMSGFCATARNIEDSTPTPPPILTTELSGSDLQYFTDAASQMALLAQLSDLAKKHAVTPEVQAEAATLWKEQTDAASQLKALAAKNEVTVTDEPDGEGIKVLLSLSKLEGVKFDKSFLDAQSDAQDALETTLALGAKSADADIKALAQADLDILKAERDRVRKLGL